MQAILEQEVISGPLARPRTDEGIKESVRKVGFFSSLFGCWHPRLTRPISDKNTTYQACVKCGARRQFDTNTFKPSGPYYYPAKVDPQQMLSA